MDRLMTRAEYDKYLKEIPSGACTFCDPKTQYILKEFNNWIWIANIAPYWRYHTMIIPRRHFEKFTDMTFIEAGELTSVVDYGEKKIIDSRLLRKDGSLVEKVVYFWRHRVNNFDPQSKTYRPSHFHIHLSPDQDRLWDPIVDASANQVDMSVLK